MSRALLHSKSKVRVLFLTAGLFLLAFTPLIMPPSGLSTPEAIGGYLNGVFPADAPVERDFFLNPAFPNLTFDSPLTWATHPHDDKIFVGQRDGKVFYFTDDETVSGKTSFLDLSPEVGVVWDGGFLGFAFHPNFGLAGATGRNYFFVYYSTPDINDLNDSPTPQRCPQDALYDGSYLVLQRYEVIEGTLTVDVSKTIDMFKVRLYNSTHRGGGLIFGDDGLLYLTTGDQAQHSTAQDMSTNLDGGVLRFDVDMDPIMSHPPSYVMPKDLPRAPDETSGNGYFIPNDNPFVGQANIFEEYYTLGHRNPHRMTKDRQTGIMYIGEVGSGNHEEINVVQQGQNYGWPVWEGSLRKNVCISSLYLGMTHTLPLTQFPRSEANSIIGGYVYRGSAIPSLFGTYICADWGGGGEVWSVDISTGTYQQVEGTSKPISFGEDANGELYILRQGTGVQLQKLVPNAIQNPPPATLSQTGAFSDLSTLEPADGIIPYDMYESFWSDGALKKRWMAVPNDGSHNTAAEQIAYSQEGEWEFPEGTVLIKHFELPIDEQNPSITRRLETRFTIVGTNQEVYGLTYKWRADGSDADLLTDALDENITIATPSGNRTQTWHYPSRSECLTCHNEAVGGTLGPRTRYLNNDFLYPSSGIEANQLVTLSALGIIPSTITDADVAALPQNARQDDPAASLEEKSRSYLDLNCGYCHRPNGEGGRAVFDARITTALEDSKMFTNQLNVSLNIPGERIIYKGDTSKSVLYQRIHSNVPGIAMPPLAKNEIDEQGAALIAEWIQSLENDVCEEINIALGKTATQSSTYTSGINFSAGNAIDGNREGASTGNSITHTNANQNAWWEVDLGAEYTLTSINLWNRTDCCSDRLSDFYVLSSDRPFGSQDLQETLTQPGVQATRYTATVARSLQLELNASARYVRVQLAGSGILTLAEVEVMVCPETQAPPPSCVTSNVALGKSATQSSLGWGGVASRAVDGNNAGVYGQQSITHTQADQHAWWEVDLGQVYSLAELKLWNRTDCCSQRLTDFYVLSSETPFPSTDLETSLQQTGVHIYRYTGIAGRETSIYLDNQARYVRVQLAGTGYLSIAEAEVMACTPPPSTCNEVNVAQGKTATQSSLYPSWRNFGASSAIDGNTDGLQNNNSITHTLYDQNAWWEVDLGSVYSLSKVTLWNRTDCCSGRLSNFYVLTSDVPFESQDLTTTLNQSSVTVAHFTGTIGVSGDVALNTTGRYVRIQLAGTGYLTIAEAEIMACSTEPSNCSQSNLALGKSASQSSLGWGGVPSRAVDGNTAGVYNQGSITHTQADQQSWWEVDLGTSSYLSEINLWNRTDCCAGRMSDFYVLSSLQPFASTDLETSLYQPGVQAIRYRNTVGRNAVIPLNTTARYVRIQLVGTGYLSIAEAEIMGCEINSSRTGDPSQADFLDLIATPEVGTVTLNWAMNLEENINTYRIERSADGQIFEGIDKVKAEGWYEYDSQDETPLLGKSFYRISALGLDGQTFHSTIQEVVFEGSAYEVIVWKNPITEGEPLVVAIHQSNPLPAQIIVVNLEGKTLLRRQVDGLANKDKVEFDVSGFAKGMYWVQVSTENWRSSKSFVIH